MKSEISPTEALAYPQHVAAKVLGISDSLLSRWEKAGIVTAIRVGTVKLYAREELQRLITEKLAEARAKRATAIKESQ
jgi:predicted site-specific integrase-resolvase